MEIKEIINKISVGISEKEDDESRMKMKKIFNHYVKYGDRYTLVCCRSKKNFTNAVIVDIPRFQNYIVGYKESGERALVIIPVSPDLRETQKPLLLTKRNGSSIEYSKFDNCNAQTNEVSFILEVILYSSKTKCKDHKQIAILQSKEDEQSFIDFFKQGL